MPNVLLDISTYLVFEYGGPQGLSDVRAVISLGVPNATATLFFYPDNVAIPNNLTGTDMSGQKWYNANYPYYQYAGVIDLLRNEQPVKFFFRDDNLATYITTSHEPVGEGE
jgi:hypothetical protein